MTPVLRVVVLILAASVWTATSKAAGSPFPDIQRILENKKLVVAILAADVPPMIMTNEAGQPMGFDVDLAEDISWKLGVAIEFVRTADTFDGVVRIVARRQADIAVSFLSRSAERAKQVYFTDPYVKQGGLIIYNRVGWSELREKFPWLKEIRQIPGTEAATNVEVGVQKGSIYAARFARDLPQIRTRTYDTFPEMVAAVKDGKIFAAYHGEIQIQYYMREHPETNIRVGIDPLVRNPSNISIAVRPDAPNLLHWLNIYLANNVGALDVKGLLQRYKAQQARDSRDVTHDSSVPDKNPSLDEEKP